MRDGVFVSSNSTRGISGKRNIKLKAPIDKTVPTEWLEVDLNTNENIYTYFFIFTRHRHAIVSATYSVSDIDTGDFAMSLHLSIIYMLPYWSVKTISLVYWRPIIDPKSLGINTLLLLMHNLYASTNWCIKEWRSRISIGVVSLRTKSFNNIISYNYK